MDPIRAFDGRWVMLSRDIRDIETLSSDPVSGHPDLMKRFRRNLLQVGSTPAERSIIISWEQSVLDAVREVHEE